MHQATSAQARPRVLAIGDRPSASLRPHRAAARRPRSRVGSHARGSDLSAATGGARPRGRKMQSQGGLSPGRGPELESLLADYPLRGAPVRAQSPKIILSTLDSLKPTRASWSRLSATKPSRLSRARPYIPSFGSSSLNLTLVFAPRTSRSFLHGEVPVPSLRQQKGPVPQPCISSALAPGDVLTRALSLPIWQSDLHLSGVLGSLQRGRRPRAAGLAGEGDGGQGT